MTILEKKVLLISIVGNSQIQLPLVHFINSNGNMQ